jgi:hypothetical protein
MNPTKHIVIAAALSALVSLANLAGAQAAGGVETIKPLQGVSFHAGTTHAAGYYLRDNSTCQLVLTFADDANFAPSRFETAIETGRSTRYQLNGKALEFACQANGQELAVTSLQATAAN